MYQDMGPVFTVGGPGRRYTVLAGPEANRRFPQWEDTHLHSGPVYRPYLDDLGSENIVIAMDGDSHRTVRKWLRPGFSREAISAHLPRMTELAKQTARNWDPDARINVTNEMQKLVSEMSGLALAGCPVGDHFADAKRFAHTFLGAGVGSFPGIMRWLPGYRRARGRFMNFLRGVIAQHDGPSPGRPPDLIDLLSKSDLPTGQPPSEMDILANAHMPYTNSLVYVGATCGFMIYELLKHPEILKEVQQEADALFGSDALTMSQLRGARWLKAALKETQRLHPISLSLPRFVHRSFEFEGFEIEKGTMTLTATAVTQFLPEFFPEPERFDVTRYWAPRFEHRQPGAIVPYGLGPHVCMSAGIVNVLAIVAVGSLLSQVELALDSDDYELGLSVAPFPAPEKGFSLRVKSLRMTQTTSSESGATLFSQLDDTLAEIDAKALEDAVAQAETRAFPAGSTIIRQGEVADALYILGSGQVEVLKQRNGGEPQLMATLRAGDYFGEIGLLQEVSRTATVRAVSDVETIVLDRDSFVSLVAEIDLTSAEIAAVMHRRLTSNALALALPRLTEKQVSQFSPRGKLSRYDPGETIIRQGDPAELFYIVVRGSVDVVTKHPDGREIHLNQLGEGDYFGEIGLLKGRPRNATVKADAQAGTEVMALGRDDFLEAMAGSESSSEQVALQMAERLTQLIMAGEAPE
jgi:cytochrome P450/CRP-like cAMP-binding protein